MRLKGGNFAFIASDVHRGARVYIEVHDATKRGFHQELPKAMRLKGGNFAFIALRCPPRSTSVHRSTRRDEVWLPPRTP